MSDAPLFETIPEQCELCKQFPDEYVLSRRWVTHLAELVARYPGEGVEPDLASMTDMEIWGLLLHYLTKLDA